MHDIIIQKGRRKYVFLNAAIRFNIDEKDIIMYGERHCNIIQKIAEMGFTSDYKKSHIDGFLCKVVTRRKEKIIFLSRDEATKIAKKAKYPMIGSVLTSEDLW